MSRLLLASSLVAVPLLVAGGCCNPCRPRCAPCGPAAGGGVVVMTGPGAKAVVTARPVPAPGAPGKSEEMVLRMEGDEYVLVGPGGDAWRGRGAQFRVVEKDGRKIYVLEEGEDKGKEGAERHEGEKRVAPVAPAPAETGRGYLGFTPLPIDVLPPEARSQLKITAEHGIVVARVFKGSPAEKAGLREGDLLVKYAGHDLPTGAAPEDFLKKFAEVVQAVKPGDVVEVVVLRDGKTMMTLRATAVGEAAMKKLAPAEDDEDEEGDEGHEKGEGHEGAAPHAPKAPAPGGK